jgi:hypothetical protein
MFRQKMIEEKRGVLAQASHDVEVVSVKMLLTKKSPVLSPDSGSERVVLETR